MAGDSTQAEGWLVGTEYTAVTTIHQPAVYSLVLPPDDFAANMRKSQSWLPYEGTVVLTEKEVGNTSYIGRAINIDNHMPEYADMRALPQSVDLNLASGIISIRLGSSPRQSLNGILNRVKQGEDDNIVFA